MRDMHGVLHFIRISWKYLLKAETLNWENFEADLVKLDTSVEALKILLRIASALIQDSHQSLIYMFLLKTN